MAAIDQSHPHIRNILWPFIWIAAGLILLFNNFGLISWSIWSTLWRFWPLLLIFWGMSLIFGRTYMGRLMVIITAFIVVLLVIALLLSGSFAPTPIVEHVYGATYF